MSAPQNNLILFTPGTVIQSAQVNQNFNDLAQLSGNSVGSQLQTLLSNNFSGFVQSGGIITTASGLTVNMSAAYIVVGGITYYMPAQAFTVTASKDTYIDFVPGTVPTYQAQNVANNAASPSLYATNAVRMGIVVSGVASITYNNQGDPAATAPTVSSNTLAVCDSIGNLICPRDPTFKLLGYRQITGTVSIASATPVPITGLSCPVIVPAGRKIKITGQGNQMSTTAIAYLGVSIWDGVAGSGTQLNEDALVNSTANAYNYNLKPDVTVLPSVANKTYSLGARRDSGTCSILSGATTPSFIRIELE